MKKSEIIETVIIVASIASFWPMVWWYKVGPLYKIPEIYITLYKLFLGIVSVALVVILVRRIRRIRKAIRDAKRQKDGRRGKFLPF